MIGWYAVHTKPNAENKAAFHLTRQDFKVFLPKFLKRRSHARKVDWVPSPLFPRYLFVGLDVTQKSWRAIQSTVGVSHLVSFGEGPLEVPKRIIDALFERENEKGLIEFKGAPEFKKGDTVQFLDQAFGDSLAKFETLDAQGRVTLLLNLMGREVKVKAPIEKIAVAG